MHSNTRLIEHLVDTGTLRTKALIEAFSLVDRKDFVPEAYQELAYMDNPLPLGHEATISQPTTVAFMLELLEPGKGQKVLDVGSGSGWTTALLASIIGEEGMVLGTEVVPELVQQGQQNIAKYDFTHACIDKAEHGYPQQAPYDRILVSASAQELPEALTKQLRVGGTMVVPVQDAILRVRRTSESGYEQETYPGFAFVPLQDTREGSEA